MRNIDKLLIELEELNLPIEDYLIVSSGPMAAHDIRECNDLDLLISEKLFHELSQKHPVVQDEVFPIQKISLGNIECLYRSFSSDDPYDFAYQRGKAEMIHGFPFQDLETCLYFKENSPREKDKKDAELIKNYLSKNV